MPHRSLSARCKQWLVLLERIHPHEALLFEQTAANQERYDPLCHGRRHACNFFVTHRRERKEPRRPQILGVGIDAVENDRVKMGRS